MPDRAETASLVRWLSANACRMSFFQLVLLFLRAQKEAVAPGGNGPLSDEPLRFAAALLMGFAASDVESIEKIPPRGEAEERQHYRMIVNFMGLYGPASPMPNHVTEELLWQDPENRQVRDFLDIFNHRMISFVFRAWQKVRHYVQFEPDGSDRFTARALSLVGLGTEGAAAALGFSPLVALRTAGLFADQRRPAVGLAGLLREQFAVPTAIESCIPREATIPPGQRMRLGARACALGQDACLGERVRDIGSAFRVRLGPLAVDRFRQFLPGHPAFRQLVQLTRLYCQDLMDFDLEIVLHRGAAPPLRLSAEAELPLGQMSWILPRGEADETVTIPTRTEDPLYTQDAVA